MVPIPDAAALAPRHPLLQLLSVRQRPQQAPPRDLAGDQKAAGRIPGDGILLGRHDEGHQQMP